MLSDDIFLSAEMKHGYQNRMKPWKDWKEVWTKNGTVKPSTKYPQEHQLRNSYAELIQHLFFATIKKIDTTVYMHILKENALSAAAIRHVLPMFENPYFRVSFPSLYEPGNRDVNRIPRTKWFVELFIESYDCQAMDQYCETDEIVPGLKLEQLLFIMMEDESFFATQGPTMVLMVLTILAGKDRRKKCIKAWKNLSIDNRVLLLDSFRDFTKYNLPPNNRFAPGSDRLGVMGEGNQPIDLFLVNKIMCDSTNTLLKIYENLKETVRKREPINPWALDRVEFMREQLLDEHVFRTKIYLEMIEPRYQQQQIANNDAILSFPEEIIELITEFTLQPTCEFADG